jgi:hypothetical protein
MTGMAYREHAAKAASGEKEAAAWVSEFRHLGQLLFFDTDVVLPRR